MDRLEALGELARDDKLALRPERRGESVERGRNPVRRFVEHQRAAEVAQALDLSCPRACGRRKKAAEQPLRRRKPGRGQRGDDGARTRNRHHRKAGVDHRSHQRRTGIAYRRGSRVGHERDSLTAGEPGDDLVRALPLIVRVQGCETALDAIVRRQRCGDSRVLRGDDIGLTQDVERAQGDVAQITDGRCDHI